MLLQTGLWEEECSEHGRQACLYTYEQPERDVRGDFLDSLMHN